MNMQDMKWTCSMSHLPEGGLDSAKNIRNLVKSHTPRFSEEERITSRRGKKGEREETKEPTTAAPRVLNTSKKASN